MSISDYWARRIGEIMNNPSPFDQEKQAMANTSNTISTSGLGMNGLLGAANISPNTITAGTLSVGKAQETSDTVNFTIKRATNGYVVYCGSNSYVAKSVDELVDAIKTALVSSRLEVM